MLSRVANSIYWMARYAERAESLARFIEVTINFSLDQPDGVVEQWEPLVRASGDEKYYAEHYGEFHRESVCRFLTFDPDYSNSIQSSIKAARENARTVREAIASEAWEQLNVLYHFVNNASTQPGPKDEAFYNEIVRHCYMLKGILSATMTRGDGWHFANVGRLLERADKTSRILDVKYFTLLRNVHDVDTTFDDLLWSAVLRSACGLEMFRKRYRALTVERIVDFLVFDDKCPRSVLYSVHMAGESLAQIPGPADSNNDAAEKAWKLAASLRGTDAKSIIKHGLHEFTDSLQLTLNAISSAVHKTYFALRPFANQSQSQQQG